MPALVRLCSDNLLVSVALCFIAGCAGAFSFAETSWHLPAIMAIVPFLLLVSLAILLPAPYRPISALLLFLLLGWWHTQQRMQPPTDPSHLAHRIQEKTKVTLVGRILSLVEYDGERSRFELEAFELLDHATASSGAAFEPVRGKVLVSVEGDITPLYQPGMTVMAIASLDRIRSYQTPGAFDYRLHMATRSIACSAWVDSARSLVALASRISPWDRLRALPEHIRQHIFLFLQKRLDSDIAGLYQALLVGSRVNIAPDQLEWFKNSGCMHVLAISGLHLSLLGLMAAAACSFLLKRSLWLMTRTHVPTLALALTAPLLLFYAFIAGLNIPALRALAMAVLVLIAVMLRRRRSLLAILAAAALFVLFLNPLALFTASFQLSFGAVLAIVAVSPTLLRILSPDQERDPPRRSWLQAARAMLIVSLAATLGTLPFMLYHFNRFSLIGPVMNLAVEPLLCFWALPWGLAALPFIAVYPDLADLFLEIGGLGIRISSLLVEAAAHIPWASLWTITPSLLDIALFILLLLLLVSPWKNRPRTIALVILPMALLASFTFSLWNPIAGTHLTVSYLDVGQGTSTLLQFPDGTNALIDGGGNSTDRFNIGQSVIAPFLWKKQIWRLDALILTHPHRDHYNGVPFVADRFRPHRLIVNGDMGEEPEYRQFLESAQKGRITMDVASAGQVLLRGEDYTLTCAGMNGLQDRPFSWSTNDRSLVLRLQFGSTSFLFPADIGHASERLLLGGGQPLQAEVLLAPHHGSITSGSRPFLDAVSPSLIVVSCGTTRQGVQPAPAHLTAWRDKAIIPLITAEQGTITCRTDGSTLQVSTYNGQHVRLDNQRQGAALMSGLPLP